MKLGTTDRLIRAASLHYEELRHLALRLVNKNHSDAEDVLQTLFLKLTSLDDAYARKVANPLAFFKAIVHNVAIDLHRHNRSAVSGPIQEDDIRNLVTEDHDNEREEEDEIWRKRAALLFEAIRARPSPEQQILELHYFYGMSRRDIARRIGVTETHVKSCLSSSLRRLRKQLG